MTRALAALLLVVACAKRETPAKSAFLFGGDPDVKCSIDRTEIVRGVGGTGDPRDGIPAIREPRAVAADAAPWLRGEERVLGVEVNGDARAYPTKILEQHEMVNDVLGGEPIAPNY